MLLPRVLDKHFQLNSDSHWMYGTICGHHNVISLILSSSKSIVFVLIEFNVLYTNCSNISNKLKFEVTANNSVCVKFISSTGGFRNTTELIKYSFNLVESLGLKVYHDSWC